MDHVCRISQNNFPSNLRTKTRIGFRRNDSIGSMNLNPTHYFLKRYHSPDLRPKELKRMLNLWFPFLVNRISIISISDDFHHMQVCLKHSFWNRNPNKSIWGGSIASAMDPFFPILMKQILLRKGLVTDFYSKAVNIQFIKMVKSDVTFQFSISDEEVVQAEKDLDQNGKYEGWHSVEGIAFNGKVCVKGEVQIFLRKR